VTWPDRWRMSTIGELTESVEYGTSERSTDAGDLPVLRMGNVSYEGYLDLRELKYM
jgi:type I restriction enzyme S subunit